MAIGSKKLSALLERARGLAIAGDFTAAESVIKEILSKAPQCSDALFLLGTVFCNTNRSEDAVEYLRKSISINRQFLPAYNSLGNAFQLMDRHAEAITIYAEALKIDSTYGEALINMGHCYLRLKDGDRALACYKRIASNSKHSFAAEMGIGTIYIDKREYLKAIEHLSIAISIKPEDGAPHIMLGNAYRGLARFDEAMASYRRAIEIAPKNATALNNLGLLLFTLNDHEGAIELYKRAMKIIPNDARCMTNLANAIKSEGRLDEAIPLYKKALAISPEDSELHFNYSLALLRTGDFKRGWPEYDHRLRTAGFEGMRRYKQPLWDGSSLFGKSILFHREQGIGDEIITASCIPELVRMSGCCIVECDPRLVPLFSRSFPKAVIRSKETKATSSPLESEIGIDYQIPCGSAMRYLRPDLASFPSSSNYLVADPKRREEFRKLLLRMGDKPKVGISWRSGRAGLDAANPVRIKASTNIDQWKKLLSFDGCDFISLQYGDVSEELELLERNSQIRVLTIEDLDTFNDIEGLAALIAELDLVITIPNVTMVLAQTVGTETWAPLERASGGFWHMVDGKDCAFPEIRYFRQPKQGDWSTVFVDLRSAAEEFFARPKSNLRHS